ncbi:MAG TPA: sigma factor, partial [Edaphobacter sp.]
MDVAAEWTRYAEKDQPALKEAGEEEFTSLVERNARRMFRVAYSLLRNTHDAEDAVQEAFLKLHRTQGWRRIEDERAFLSRTVWRVALDRLPPARAMEDTTA